MPIQLVSLSEHGHPGLITHLHLVPFIKLHASSGCFHLSQFSKRRFRFSRHVSVPICAPHDELTFPPFGHDSPSFHGNSIDSLLRKSPIVLTCLGFHRPLTFETDAEINQIVGYEMLRTTHKIRAGNFDGWSERAVRQSCYRPHNAAPARMIRRPLIPPRLLPQSTLLGICRSNIERLHSNFKRVECDINLIGRRRLSLHGSNHSQTSKN